MSAIQKLVNEVLRDAEVHGAEVVITVNGTTRSLGATYMDDVGTIRYYVSDTDLLLHAIQVEVEDEEITEVDAFWSIMNTVYKI